MDALEHLSGPGAGRREALAEHGVLALQIGEPKLEVEGAKIRGAPVCGRLLQNVRGP